jgi:hypothetical protein
MKSKIIYILLFSLLSFSCNYTQEKKIKEKMNEEHHEMPETIVASKAVEKNEKSIVLQTKTYHFNKIQITEENSDFSHYTRASRTIVIEYYEKSVFLTVYEDSKTLMVLDGTLSKKNATSFGNCDM